MAKISLKAKLASISLLNLVFTDMSVQKGQDGKDIIVFQMANMIPYVRGSQEVEHEGQTKAIFAEDVNEIKVHENDLNDDFFWDNETEVGGYIGKDLVLDVAKNSGQVWLRSVPFSVSGRQYAGLQRNKRYDSLFGKKDDANKENTGSNPADPAKVIVDGAKVGG